MKDDPYNTVFGSPDGCLSGLSEDCVEQLDILGNELISCYFESTKPSSVIMQNMRNTLFISGVFLTQRMCAYLLDQAYHFTDYELFRETYGTDYKLYQTQFLEMFSTTLKARLECCEEEFPN